MEISIYVLLVCSYSMMIINLLFVIMRLSAGYRRFSVFTLLYAAAPAPLPSLAFFTAQTCRSLDSQAFAL